MTFDQLMEDGATEAVKMAKGNPEAFIKIAMADGSSEAEAKELVEFYKTV